MSRAWAVSSPQLIRIAELEEEVANLRSRLALVRRDIRAKDLVAAFEHTRDSSEQDDADEALPSNGEESKP